LDQVKIEQIHRASLHIMEKIGMRMGGQRALNLFEEQGAAVGSDG
jgi:trimethylamine--corrinoid protein Co-methyltransferase